MAIVYSYPLSTSILPGDMVVGTSIVNGSNGKKKNQTKNFSMGQIATFVKEQVTPYNTYNVYTALLNQTSGNAPEATVLQNTFGIDFTWDIVTTGAYTCTAPSALFTEGKTFVSITRSTPFDVSIQSYWLTGERDTDTVVGIAQTEINYDGGVINYNGPANGFTNVSIEIRVYN
jgi:hypothetical protein